jgi:hypothetical protein
MRQRWFKRLICSAVIVTLLCAVSGPVLAQEAKEKEKESIVRSALVPGTGQAHEGHYTKAAIFAGAAVVTGVGLFLSQVHYNEAVMRYNDLAGIYNSYPSELGAGTVIPYSDINQTYSDMQTAWDKSEDRKVWRNVFLGAFLVTYTLNLIDILMVDRETGELPEDTGTATGMIGFQLSDEEVMVYKSFDF